MPEKKWVIKDWTGQILRWSPSGGIPLFGSFEDAWGFIYENSLCPPKDSPHYDEYWYDDYFVEEFDGA